MKLIRQSFYGLSVVFIFGQALLSPHAWCEDVMQNISKPAWSDTHFSGDRFMGTPRRRALYGDPTPAEQAFLEALNRARSNPLEEADRLGIDLFEGVATGEISDQPVQPVTLNSQLTAAASQHSADMLINDYFEHNSLSGLTPFDRIKNAGYRYFTAGENLAWLGATAVQGEVSTGLKMHDDLFIDKEIEGRGHRVNMLNEHFKEVGIALATGYFADRSPPYNYYLTCDFGASSVNSNPFLLGVVFNDQNHNGLYDAGEGIKGALITLLEDKNTRTLTATAGGYALQLSKGAYTVEATLPDDRTAQTRAVIRNLNIKRDFMITGDSVFQSTVQNDASSQTTGPSDESDSGGGCFLDTLILK